MRIMADDYVAVLSEQLITNYIFWKSSYYNSHD